MKEPRHWILLLWGAPAAGKSTLARYVVELYSKVHRVGLCHLGTDRLNQSVLDGRFDGEIRESLYGSLVHLTEELVSKGRPVLVEGTFLKPAWRERLLWVARCRGVPALSVQIECRLALRESRNQGRSNADFVPQKFLRTSHEEAKNQLGDADFVFDTELMNPERLAQFLLDQIQKDPERTGPLRV